MGAVATAAVAVMMAAVHDMWGPQGRGGHEELLHREQARAPPRPQDGQALEVQRAVRPERHGVCCRGERGPPPVWRSGGNCLRPWP